MKCDKILREGLNNDEKCVNADSCRNRPIRCTREHCPVCGKLCMINAQNWVRIVYQILPLSYYTYFEIQSYYPNSRINTVYFFRNSAIRINTNNK
jgi:hypothetical protein